MVKEKIAVFWFRRDLRLDDNAGLYHALKSEFKVLPIFIFDKNILDKLEDNDDARISFIYQEIEKIKNQIQKQNSSLLVKYGKPDDVWTSILSDYDVKEVYTNHDYEPYAVERDGALNTYFSKKDITFFTYKDQVIFEKSEIVKDDGKPYVVFTPYKRKWLAKLNSSNISPYPTEKYFNNFIAVKAYDLPSLKSMGFERSNQHFPDQEFKSILKDYSLDRDFPVKDATSRISVHLRFGTVSLRDLVKVAQEKNSEVWLSELIWRDFYFSILFHFPYSATASFRKEYDLIKWRNNEVEFKAWCEGKTGYPIVDAGMRQLNESGFMHNRIRMVVASFLTKHLLIDWRWGERYFARKLLDYELSSNVGGWQWAAGSGVDAAPYFRIFNPYEQVKKFDKDHKYIKEWVPEYADPFHYPKPIVDHKIARERCLETYKKALK